MKKRIKANCTNCESREVFENIGNGKYKCMVCDSIMHKCKGSNCERMIKHGPYCNKCLGNKLKNGGMLTVTVLMSVGTLVTTILKKKIKNG